jgi:hypothetical protein
MSIYSEIERIVREVDTQETGLAGVESQLAEALTLLDGKASGGGGSDDSIDELIEGTLTEITSNATKISDYSFYYSKLTKANFPSATSIGQYAFSNSSNLAEINFPLVTLIGKYALQYCTSLRKASFPSATSIGDYAFFKTTPLRELYFPLVTSIGQHAFNGDFYITRVDFPLVTSIGSNAFDGCSGLAELNFPLLTSISTYAFRACPNLIDVSFPSVTSINGYAFQSCSKLAKVDFPSLASISSSAFQSCTILTAVILRSETMVTLSNTNAFNNCYHILGTKNSTYNPEGLKDGYFYVPRALLSDTDEANDYRRAKNWSTFATQFRALEDYTVDGTITGELDESKI